jgi:hypothetical protein
VKTIRMRQGAETATQEDFLARMKAQCHQIERYRLDVLRNEGRELSPDEAALEWIERYAEGFDEGARGSWRRRTD